MDERFIDGGPEGRKQDVQFLRPHIRPADAPLCLRQKGAGGFVSTSTQSCWKFAYWVPSEREQQNKIVVPGRRGNRIHRIMSVTRPYPRLL